MSINELATLRRAIDEIDSQLLALLAQRQRKVAEVIAVKSRTGIPARVPERVAEVINGVVAQAPQAGVDPALARTVWTAMVDWFIAHEEAALAAPAPRKP